MTRDLLSDLDASGAFSSSPSDHLQDLFVPFKELVDEAVEDRLGALIAEGRRVALIGPSGCGKSSVASDVTRGGVYAALEIPVNSDPEVARDEKLFGQHLVRTIGRWGRELGAMTDEDVRQAKADTSDREERPGHRSVTRFGGGANLGVVKGDLGRELGAEGARIDQPIPTQEVGEVVLRMLQLIRLREIIPVIIVDDSDRWLSDADKTTVDIFFGRIMRWIAALDTSMVVAVHEAYRAAEGYQQARRDGWIEEEIWIPALTDSTQFGRLLARRVTARSRHRHLADAFEGSAVEEVFGYYLSGARLSLRRTLTVCQEAVRQAAKDPEASVVTAAAARSAMAEFA